MLWRIEFFVEGKHLEKVLTGVAGYALNMGAPQPVTNAINKGGKLIQDKPSATKIDQLIALIQKRGKGNQVTTKDITAHLVSIGSNKTTTSGFVGQLVKLKVIKRKSQALYTVL